MSIINSSTILEVFPDTTRPSINRQVHIGCRKDWSATANIVILFNKP